MGRCGKRHAATRRLQGAALAGLAHRITERFAMAAAHPQPVEDALSLLGTDHDEIAELFDDYETLVSEDASNDERRELAEEICTLLTVHSAIEEQVFYPALREVLGDGSPVDHALEEHADAKEVIDDIVAGDPTEPRYDELVMTLRDLVADHVREEEAELFARARNSSLDLDDLGAQMSALQEEMLSADESDEI
jgi:hemerythrin superfamily protein